MLKSEEAISLNLFIHESFSFKRFWDNYVEMRNSIDRFTLTEDYVRECSLDHHRGLHEQTISEVTNSLITFMEGEVDRLESQPKKGSSL